MLGETAEDGGDQEFGGLAYQALDGRRGRDALGGIVWFQVEAYACLSLVHFGSMQSGGGMSKFMYCLDVVGCALLLCLFAIVT